MKAAFCGIPMNGGRKAGKRQVSVLIVLLAVLRVGGEDMVSESVSLFSLSSPSLIFILIFDKAR